MNGNLRIIGAVIFSVVLCRYRIEQCGNGQTIYEISGIVAYKVNEWRKLYTVYKGDANYLFYVTVDCDQPVILSDVQ